jgi:hypothetical protein
MSMHMRKRLYTMRISELEWGALSGLAEAAGLSKADLIRSRLGLGTEPESSALRERIVELDPVDS